MIFHISIEADDPERTARMMAEIWRGKAYPFPPVAKGSWVAMAGDERNSTVEVYPRGTDLLRPAYDLYGQLFVVDRTSAGAGLSVVRAGDARTVRAPGLTGPGIINKANASRVAARAAKGTR